MIGVIMADDENTNVPMAECGACRASIPADSTQCPECKVRFSGSSDEQLGECGACMALVPVDSRSCPNCGVVFVADDVLDVLRKWVATTGISIRMLFDKFDVNKDGEISSEELKEGLLGLNLADLPPSQVDRLVSAIDEDGNGTIDLKELEITISGEAEKESTDQNNDVETSETEAEEEETPEEDSHEESDESEEVLADEEEESNVEDDSSQDDDDYSDRELIESDLASYLISHMDDNEMDITRIFNELDSDGNGSISYVEILARMQDMLGYNISAGAFEEFFDISDNDGDGEIDLQEFVELVEALDGYENYMEDDDSEIEEEYVEGDVINSNLIKHLVRYFDDNEIDVTRAFSDMDEDGNGTLTREEIESAISGMLDAEVSGDAFDEIFSQLDEDGDGGVDIIEFVGLIEEVEDHVEEETEEVEEDFNKFPSPLQLMMMKKSFHDNAYVIVYGFFGLLIGLLLVNGLVGPVDGSGGLVEFASTDGDQIGFASNGDTVRVGDVYECDELIQDGKCRNSLTPLAGTDGASSMPKGFYWDGILGMVISLVGIVVGAVFQLAIVPGWRARYKAMKEQEQDHEDAQEEKEESKELVDIDESEEEEEVEYDDEDVDEEDIEDEEEFDDEDDDSDEEEEEGIDIGTRVGVEDEDGDWFGVVVEFDEEDDSIVIVKSEDDDEEYEVEWDLLFMPDDE